MSNETQFVIDEDRFRELAVERAVNEWSAKVQDLERKLKIRDSEIERLEFALQSERDCVLRLQRALNKTGVHHE